MTKILLVYNPIAGRGRARLVAARLATRLRDDGVEVERLEPGVNGQTPAGDARPDAIVVLGGDGTVHAFAHLARTLDAPVYQYPLGTENLFAREFGMDRRYATLRRALERGHVDRVDVASVNGHTFLLMVSVGPDAGIIHRLATVRTGAIHHLTYVPHIAAEMRWPSLPELRVTADGRELVGRSRGLLVVANSRQYALRIDPAKDACVRDGLLDVVFFPVSGRFGLLKWLTLSRLRMQDRRGRIAARAREVTIEGLDGPIRYQFDGEAGAPVGSNGAPRPELRLAVEPAALPVLVP